MALLEMIQNPSDLRNLRPELLPDVAKEVRQKIIEVTAQTGGHLGASLGCTDLAIARTDSDWDAC